MYHAGMKQLNYHHLQYFWSVVREGGVSAASRRLRVSQPTISSQIHALERQVGDKLFERVGRKLTLTETGRRVYRYANEIFALGRELMDALNQRAPETTIRVSIGVADVLPKLLAFRMIRPALELPESVTVSCHESTPTDLLSRLAVFDLDVVLTDSPIGPDVRVAAYNHLLGESALGWFAARSLAARCRKGFPDSLNGAKVLMQTEGCATRRSVDQWCDLHDVRPTIAGEFDDSSLMKVFAQEGHGLFAAPLVIAKEMAVQYDVRLVGELRGVRQPYYAISAERTLKHPAVLAITETARNRIF